MNVKTIDQDATREDLLEALGHVNREAQRCMRVDHLGRPSERWESLHAFINALLDMLEEA